MFCSFDFHIRTCNLIIFMFLLNQGLTSLTLTPALGTKLDLNIVLKEMSKFQCVTGQ